MTRAGKLLEKMSLGQAKEQFRQQMGNAPSSGSSYTHKSTYRHTNLDHPVAGMAHGAGKIARKIQDNPKAAVAAGGAALVGAAMMKRRRR